MNFKWNICIIILIFDILSIIYNKHLSWYLRVSELTILAKALPLVVYK